MEETLLENYMSLKCCSNFCLKIDFVNFPFGWENSTSRKVIQTLKGILLKIMVSQVSSCHTTVLMKNKSCYLRKLSIIFCQISLGLSTYFHCSQKNLYSGKICPGFLPNIFLLEVAVSLLSYWFRVNKNQDDESIKVFTCFYFYIKEYIKTHTLCWLLYIFFVSDKLLQIISLSKKNHWELYKNMKVP